MASQVTHPVTKFEEPTAIRSWDTSHNGFPWLPLKCVCSHREWSKNPDPDLPVHYTTVIWLRSHAHTVVWECCKDDQRSQWEMLKFDQQLPLNPLSDRHQIWHAWLRRGYLGHNPLWVSSPHICEIYTPHVRMFTTFLVLPIAYSRDPCMDFNA